MELNVELQLAVKKLTMPEIVHALPECSFTNAQKRSRREMEDAIGNLPSTHHQMLVDAHHTKRLQGNTNVPTTTPLPPVLSPAPSPLSECFLQTVSDSCRKERISKFIDATGNKALHEIVCVVCTGQFRQTDCESVRISDLEEKQLLCPTHPHHAHVLTNGMLLHRSPQTELHQTDSAGFSIVDVCNTCVSCLRRNKTPPLALANDMWVGDVPLELKILMLPEWILIARYFPAAYIVKLYPKKKGSRFWANTKLHSGLRGNVSTYWLNTDDIIFMVGDNLLPASPSILAATIGVTFVGPKNVPQKTMPGFLRVNRNCVRDALAWLKKNNPLYHDIKICANRLNELPCDDVPPQIMSLVRHSDDADLVAAEHDGYVPENVDDHQGTSSYD